MLFQYIKCCVKMKHWAAIYLAAPSAMFAHVPDTESLSAR